MAVHLDHRAIGLVGNSPDPTSPRRQREQVRNYAACCFSEGTHGGLSMTIPCDMKYVPETEAFATMMQINGSIQEHIMVPQGRPRIPLIHCLVDQQRPTMKA